MSRSKLRKKGITASQAEIDKRYKEAVSHYKDEEEYKLKIEAAYGWTPELTKQTLRRQILREQLEPQVLSRRSGRYITIQHLMGGHSVNFTEEAYKARSRDYIEKIQREVETEGFDKTFNKYRLHEGTGSDPLLIAANEFSWSEKEPGADPKAIAAVFAATTVPTLSDVVETNSFYGLFNVENIGQGDYGTWEDFIGSYPSKTYPERVALWLKSGVNKVATFFGAKPVFAAHCGTTSGCEATRVYGTITDGPTGAPLGNVQVHWNIPAGSNSGNPSCLSGGTHPTCSCGPKPPTYDGSWSPPPAPFTQYTGPAGSYNFARVDGSDCFLNCRYSQWHINLSKAGYQNHREFVNLANGNTTNLNKPLWPLPATLRVFARSSEGGGYLNGIRFDVSGSSTISKDTGEIFGGFEVTKNGDSTWNVTAPLNDDNNNGVQFTFDNQWNNCNSVSGRTCTRSVNAGNTQEVTAWFRPPPTPVACSPSNQTRSVGQAASFTASGGSGTYAWIASGGNPASQSASTNSNFSTTYSAPGTYTVTVSSNGQSAYCNVTVTGGIVCSPSSQTVNVGQAANFSVSGGSGSYGWVANGGSPATSTSTSTSFSTTYSSAGTYTVTVTNSGNSANCSVTVLNTSQNLNCVTTNGTSSITVNAGQSFTLTATGNGTVAPYVWLANGATPTSQSGSSTTFSASYAAGGTSNIVNLSSNSGSLQATCNVTVNPVGSNLSCAPATQNVVVGSQASFQATRTSTAGTFSWSGGDNPATKPAGSPATSDIFSSVFNTAGNRTITVSSPGATPSSTTCQVNVTPPVTPEPEGTTPSGSVEFDQGERAPVY